MNDTILVCPQCRKDVSLPLEAQYARCPSCNRFLFRAPRSEAAAGGTGSTALQSFTKALGVVLLIIVGLAVAGVVIVSIAFVGCVAIVSRH